MVAKLQQLNLSGHALRGGLPAAMGRLCVLLELRVENAQLRTLPPELAPLPLHSLFLCDNQLSSPDACAALVELMAVGLCQESGSGPPRRGAAASASSVLRFPAAASAAAASARCLTSSSMVPS